MKKFRRLLLCLILVAALLVPMLPDAAASAPGSPDYRLADQILDGLYGSLHRRMAVKSSSARADFAERFLKSADGVEPGSVMRSGDAVYWRTDDGITCHFSPHLYELMSEANNKVEVSKPTEFLHTAAKSSATEGRDVYLIAPYYGLDDNFDGEDGIYAAWAKILAHYTGGKPYCLTQGNATVDTIARALENSAMLLIDSHGDTNTGTSGGSTSYICLQSGEGITVADYSYDSAVGASHACYGGAANGGRISFYEVDGTVIARHMKKQASANMIWNGTCYGMATKGFCAPLIAKGVSVVYGYSQAVSFGADQCWLETAMDRLTSGKTVAQAVAAAKNTWGAWDYSRTICDFNDWPAIWINDSARTAASFHDAFPVVVSAKDRFPSNPNSLQTVRSDWLLPQVELRLDFRVPDGVKCTGFPARIFYESKLPTPSGIPRSTEHSYTFVGWSLQPVADRTTRPTQIFTPGTAFSFGYVADPAALSFGDQNALLYALYTYSDGGMTWYTTQVPDGPFDPFDPSALFDDMPYGTWYYGNVRFALSNGMINGYNDRTFRPNNTIRRSEVVSILYRAAGSPAVEPIDQFSDVSPDAWYADAVAWAVRSGVVQGYADGTFRPDIPVTRAQLAVFFYRFAIASDRDTSAITAFPDNAEVPDWAAAELSWAVSNGLINGNRIDASDYLQPNHSATRAQFVAILERFITNNPGGYYHVVQ